MRDEFTKIYQENIWRGTESRSGKGSSVIAVASMFDDLEKLFKKYSVNSLVDCACGDFNWMRYFLKGKKVEYLGIDVVPYMINANKQKYKGYDFICKDITVDPIPKADLVFCRDALVHISNYDVQRFLENFKRSECKYLLTTSFTSQKKNVELDLKSTKRWRAINLSRKPFNLPDPIEIINEDHEGKHLFLYERSQING